jgi:hypothetical protein
VRPLKTCVSMNSVPRPEYTRRCALPRRISIRLRPMPVGFAQFSLTRWSPATARRSATGGASVLSVATVQVAVAGVGSTLSDGSVARTSKVCVPSARKEYVIGDAQATKVLDVAPVGPDVIVVSGGVVSVPTVQVAEAGVVSLLPEASVART